MTKSGLFSQRKPMTATKIRLESVGSIRMRPMDPLSSRPTNSQVVPWLFERNSPTPP